MDNTKWTCSLFFWWREVTGEGWQIWEDWEVNSIRMYDVRFPIINKKQYTHTYINNLEWYCVPVIPVLKRQKREDHKIDASLIYIVTSRPT